MSGASPPLRKRRWWLRILITLGILALLGIGIFALLLASWTEVERMEPEQAEALFAAALMSAGGGPAYFDEDDHGALLIRHELEAAHPPRVEAVHGLLWHAERHRFLRFDLPGWFVRTKLKVSLSIESFAEEHGLDPRSSRAVRVEDFARLGHGLLLDEHYENGSRLLIWLEGKPQR